MGLSQFLDETLARSYTETAISRARYEEERRAQKEARRHRTEMYGAANRAWQSAVRRGDKVAASIAEVEMNKWINYRP